MINKDTTYKCPCCNGVMKLHAANDTFKTYVCEICDSRLMMHVRDKELMEVVQIGDTKVYIDNQEVSNLLKKEFKQ